MAIHHHKPSMAFARARQAIRVIWIYKTKKREANKNKNKEEKKLRFDSNNNERKDLLIPVSLSVQACSHFSMKLSSPLSYINKTKIT